KWGYLSSLFANLKIPPIRLPVSSARPPLQLESPRAVAECFGLDSKLFQQCQIQIRHRCVFRISDVPAASHARNSSGDQEDWEVFVCMHVAVAERAAVYDQCMVEQRAVAISD